MSKPTNPKEETAGHRKNPSSATRAAAEQAPPQKCPRCDSPNTKFCYYNNYSLTQPRHFCKTCRRYWTRGGALRNVPVGGGCRKNKKLKSSSSDDRHVSKDSSSSSNTNNHFMLFHGISPAMDFNLAANTSTTASLFDYHQNPNVNNNNINTHNSLLSLASGSTSNNNNNNNNPSSLASSIESLSSINQDLHWKLQQQRLALLFGNNGVNNSSGGNGNGVYAVKPTKPYHAAVPILFQNLEISKPLLPRDDRMVIGSDTSQTGNMDQWFFGSDQVVQLAQAHNHPQGVNVNNAVHQGNNGNIESVTGGANWMNNNVNWTANSTSADLHQFSASLP